MFHAYMTTWKTMSTGETQKSSTKSMIPQVNE